MNHEIHVASSLPPGWDAFSLGSQASFVTSGSRGWARFYSESGDLFLRSQNIRSGHLDLEDRQHVLPPAGAEGERTRVQPNDLLVTITGNSVGNVAISSDDLGIAYISQHVGMIRLVNPSLAPYACWYLSPGAPGNRQIMDAQTGQSKPGLNLQNLKDLVVAAPKDKRERDLIVSAVDDIQAQADEMQMLLSKKRMLKQAAMQELLTGKRRLPGFEGEWEVKRLGDVAHIKTGSRNNEDKTDDGEYPFFVRSDNVERISSYSYDCEAVLVPGEGRIGEIFHYIKGRFDVHQRVYAITQFAQEISGKFIHCYMAMNFGSWAMQNTVKATVDSLRLPTFQTFEMWIPPTKDEQDAIAGVLIEIDAELAALEARKNKAQQLKQGMMQQLLTGKIRLT